MVRVWIYEWDILIVGSQDVCGEMRPLIWVEHEKIKENVLFVSTAGDQGKFVYECDKLKSGKMA